MSLNLLKQFLGGNGDPPCLQVSQKCLMLQEGRRVIFISFKYTPSTGRLRYAASVYRLDPVFETHNDSYGRAWPVYDEDGSVVLSDSWTWDEVDLACGSNAVWLDGEGKPYYEISENDVENHIATTTRRYEIRPVKMTVDRNLEYEDLIRRIRWEMCHGRGCKGVRKPRAGDADNESDTSSYLSVDSSATQVSDETYDLSTFYHARYITDTREIFIAFKGDAETGEMLYGAAIHQKSHPGDYLSMEKGDCHFETASKRLNRCPVPLLISNDASHRGYREQLLPEAPHREDVTVLVVDNILHRRGGQIQHRGARLW